MNNSTTQSPQERPTTSSAPPKRGVNYVAIGGIVVLVAAGLFWKSHSGGGRSTTKADAAPRQQVRTVKVMKLDTGTIVASLDVTGTLRSNQNVQLTAKVAGHVGQVYVKEGDRVRRGQLLVQLDDSDFRQQVDAARANLQSAQVALRQTQVGLPARIAQVNNTIDQSRAAVNTARAKYQQALLNEPSAIVQAKSEVSVAQEGVKASEASLKQARTTATQTREQTSANIKSAEAGLKQGQAQLEQVKNGSRQQQVAQAQADVNLAQARVHDAQTNLTRQTQLFQGGATAKANVDTAQTNLEVAQAQLESAQQNLSLVKEGSRTEEVTAAEEVVRQREAALAQARAGSGDVLRAEAAVTSALAAFAQAQQQLRQATSNLSRIPIAGQETRTALEAVREAESTLRQSISNRAQIPVAQADVPAAQAKVAQAQAQLEQAQLNLSYTRIVSPINGVVNTKLTDVGQSAAPGTSLLNLVALDSVYFEAQVPETQLPSIKVGQPAKVYVTAVSSDPVVGYVTEIIPVASDTLRQFRVRITLPEDNMTPAAFARGVLQTQVVKNALVVPTEVIRNEGDVNYLMVAEKTAEPAPTAGDVTAGGAGGSAGGSGSGDATSGDARGGKGGGTGGTAGADKSHNYPMGLLHRRDVRLGASAKGQSQVTGNLQVGDMVVTSAGSFMEGDKVRLALEK